MIATRTFELIRTALKLDPGVTAVDRARMLAFLRNGEPKAPPLSVKEEVERVIEGMDSHERLKLLGELKIMIDRVSASLLARPCAAVARQPGSPLN